MIEVLDGPGGRNDWGHLDLVKEEIWHEESNTTVALTTSQIMVTRGKYGGSLLSEVSDSWYLKTIMQKNPDEGFINLMFAKRLAELK